MKTPSMREMLNCVSENAFQPLKKQDGNVDLNKPVKPKPFYILGKKPDGTIFRLPPHIEEYVNRELAKLKSKKA